MSDRVHAAMNPVKHRGSSPVQYGVAVKPRLAQLAGRDHAVLTGGDLDYRVPALGEFVGYRPTNSPAPPSLSRQVASSPMSAERTSVPIRFFAQ
jgi:hypothetical protein